MVGSKGRTPRRRSLEVVKHQCPEGLLRDIRKVTQEACLGQQTSVPLAEEFGAFL